MGWSDRQAFFTLNVLFLVIFLTGCTGQQLSEEEVLTDQVENTQLITEVHPDGQKVVAVVVEYKNEIDMQSVSADGYEITAKHGETTGPRTVAAVYTSDVPVAEQSGRDGRFVIIELNEEDELAKTLFYDTEARLHERLPLDYQVTQTEDIYTVDEERIEADQNALVIEKETNLVVNSFEQKVLENQSGNTMNYQLFEPEREEGETYPVVLFLHGAGERGPGNGVPLLYSRGAIVWAEEKQQENHPAYVAVPQLPAGEDWLMDKNHQLLIELVESLKKVYPVDPDRVYVTGASYGGRGSWKLIQDHPELFAAAIPVAGPGDPEKAEAVKDAAVWSFRSADDDIIPIDGSREMMAAIEQTGEIVTRGSYPANLEQAEAESEAQELWKQADLNGSQILYTEYTEGTTPVRSHFTWISAYENEVVKDWLFSQSNEK